MHGVIEQYNCITVKLHMNCHKKYTKKSSNSATVNVVYAPNTHPQPCGFDCEICIWWEWISPGSVAFLCSTSSPELLSKNENHTVTVSLLCNKQRSVDVVCYSIALPDDTINTFLRALKDSVRPDINMVVVILPSNRKDRYDAIKTYCCVENPGAYITTFCFLCCIAGLPLNTVLRTVT